MQDAGRLWLNYCYTRTEPSAEEANQYRMTSWRPGSGHSLLIQWFAELRHEVIEQNSILSAPEPSRKATPTFVISFLIIIPQSKPLLSP